MALTLFEKIWNRRAVKSLPNGLYMLPWDTKACLPNGYPDSNELLLFSHELKTYETLHA
jgi:hypothetical protein